MAGRHHSERGQPKLHKACPDCDSPLQGLAWHCPFCGVALTDASTVRPASPPQARQAPDAPRSPSAEAVGTRLVAAPPQHPPDPQPDPAAARPPDEQPDRSTPAVGVAPPARSRRRGLVAVVLALLVVPPLFVWFAGDEPDSPLANLPPLPAPETAPPRPAQPARSRVPAAAPSPSRRIVMADERRSRQYVRPDLSSNVRVRDFPSTEHGRVLTAIAPGSEVEVTGRVSGGDWLRVSIAGHDPAYMDGRMLTTQAPVVHAARIRGHVESMRDTATLTVDGQTVSLFGVAPGTGEPYTTQMQRFIREQGNTVDCTHADQGRYRCRVRSGDLGELLLMNGAGRAAPDAPQLYFDNERLAQDNRRGIWAR